MEKLHVVGFPRLFTTGKAFGPGIAALLEGIEQNGSLRQAALSMNMSYNKAWSVLRESERNLGFLLVSRTVGGAKGGGSSLTEKGRDFLASYRAFCDDADAQLDALVEKHFGGRTWS